MAQNSIHYLQINWETYKAISKDCLEVKRDDLLLAQCRELSSYSQLGKELTEITREFDQDCYKVYTKSHISLQLIVYKYIDIILRIHARVKTLAKIVWHLKTKDEQKKDHSSISQS